MAFYQEGRSVLARDVTKRLVSFFGRHDFSPSPSSQDVGILALVLFRSLLCHCKWKGFVCVRLLGSKPASGRIGIRDVTYESAFNLVGGSCILVLGQVVSLGHTTHHHHACRLLLVWALCCRDRQQS